MTLANAPVVTSVGAHTGDVLVEIDGLVVEYPVTGGSVRAGLAMTRV